jgi:hypothetical protein
MIYQYRVESKNGLFSRWKFLMDVKGLETALLMVKFFKENDPRTSDGKKKKYYRYKLIK